MREAELRHHHGFELGVDDGWPFCDYSRLDFSGSRSGAVVAAAWAR